MCMFTPATLLLLLMTCSTRADDDGLSIWGWPQGGFDAYIKSDDSKENDNNGYFSNYYKSYPSSFNYFSNPYSSGIYQQQHHQQPGQHQQSNPYGQLTTHYNNPFSLLGFPEQDSDENTWGNVWSKFINGQNQPAQILSHSSRDLDEGKFIWNLPNGKSHTDSSEEAGHVNSVLQIGDSITGDADSSEENHSSEKSGESQVTNNNHSYGGDRSSGGTSADGDSRGDGQGGNSELYSMWPWIFKHTSGISSPLTTRPSTAASTTRKNVTPSPNTPTTQQSTQRVTTQRETTSTERATTSGKSAKTIITERMTTQRKATPTERMTTPRRTTITKITITPQRTTTPRKTTTTERTTTPIKRTISERTTTPRETTTSERTTTPIKKTTSERTITPRETTTSERTTTPRKITTTERTTTPRRTSPSTTTATSTPSTTTTTRKPTTRMRSTTTLAPSTTSSPVIPEICAGSDIIDKVGYKEHWSDCSKFIQCAFKPDGSTTVYIKTCANGTMWDQTSLSCNQPHLVNCSHDRCKIAGLDRYPSTTSCRSYWICRDGKSESVCCPSKHSYDPVKGCVPDTTCLEECKDKPIVQDVCDRRAVLNKPLVFEEYTEGQGWTLKSCVPGTAYNEMMCQCSGQNGDLSPEIECGPELYIPFTGDIKDESGNNNYLQVEGVKVIDDTGYFNGQSVIRVPRFSNLDFGDTVIIKLRYKGDGGRAGGSGVPQALLANGDCNNPSSLYLVTDQGGLTVGLQTQEGDRTNISIPSSGAGWKEAVLVADKNVLQGALNGISYQTLFTGSIDASKCALQIGRGTEFAHFQGYMDDITVYLCKPKGF